MSLVLFRNARIFDGWSAECLENGSVLVGDGVIRDVTTGSASFPGADVLECGGRTLMPGLIDAHVHVYASSCNLTEVTRRPLSYNALFACRFLRRALDCGFTTVRDVGGADVGLAQAIQKGFIVSPRLYYGGRIISQTGGHGDFRPSEESLCGCCAQENDLVVLADGVSEMRRAVRSELRRGASHIKIMASGGVASPSDPLERCQFSDDGTSAAVDEATRAGSYIAAHCHPAEAVRRCISLWGQVDRTWNPGLRRNGGACR
jgi:imidazolonepropionase-like amidohydrolase